VKVLFVREKYQKKKIRIASKNRYYIKEKFSVKSVGAKKKLEKVVGHIKQITALGGINATPQKGNF
jgi:hypothetical protein